MRSERQAMDEARYIGVDIGGTRLKLGVVSARGEVSDLRNVPTPQTREEIFGAIASFTAEHAALAPVAGVGVSMPGIIDAGGYTVTAGAVKALRNRSVQDEMAELTGLPARVSNDGRAAALAEGWVGAAQDVSDYIVFTLGTAIAAGIVLDGRLRDGLGGLAGEFGVALADIAHDDYEEHSFAFRAATVAGLCRDYSYAVHERVLDAREIYRRADAGDAEAARAIEDFYRAVAVLCVNAAVTIAPEAIVIGGGISANDRAFAGMRRSWERIIDGYPVLGCVRMPALRRAGCRNNAGMIGAVYRLICDGR